MDLTVISKKDNPLLSRTEIKAEAFFSNESTPKKDDIKKRIASIEKADEKLVVVKKIINSFGAAKVSVLAYIYNSEENLKKVEPKKKDKTAKKVEEAPKAEAKGEE